MKSPWNFSKFELLMYFYFYKAANFFKIPQEIWLTLSWFTGRQEKKDALLAHIVLKYRSIQFYVISVKCAMSWLLKIVQNYSNQIKRALR